MSDGKTIIIGRSGTRETVYRIIDAAPPGSVVNIKPPRRTLDQNAKMHAMLSDIARAKPQGRVLPAETWTFCSRIALTMSLADRPRAEARSGSIQTRIA